MGIPYSKQINSAFSQVTPLVASAYEVLQTVKDISLVILGIQVGMVVLLSLILLSLIGLLFTLNPDLEKERKTLVTPVMKWIASWSMTSTGRRMSLLGSLFTLFVLSAFGFLFYVYYTRQSAEMLLDRDDGTEAVEEGTGTDDGQEVKGGEATK